MIKCVVWDIDNTLLDGTYLEAGDQPPPARPGLLAVARTLDERGIVHALASRNPPSAAEYVAAVTGLPFAAHPTFVCASYSVTISYNSACKCSVLPART